MSSSPERNQAGPPGASEFSENLEALRQVQLFSSLPLEALKLLAYLSARETFRAGADLFREGEDDGRAVRLLSGNAALLRGPEGRRLGVFEAGSFLGGLALLAPLRRLFSLRAEGEVVGLVITRENFGKVIERFPAIFPGLLKNLAEELLSWEERFLSEHADACEPCRERVGVSLV